MGGQQPVCPITLVQLLFTPHTFASLSNPALYACPMRIALPFSSLPCKLPLCALAVPLNSALWDCPFGHLHCPSGRPFGLCCVPMTMIDHNHVELE